MSQLKQSIIAFTLVVALIIPSVSEASSLTELAEQLRALANKLDELPVGQVKGLADVNGYPDLQSTQGLSNPSLSYGLDGLADWSVEMPFIDLVKMGRSWIVHQGGGWGGGSTNGILDENGWPTSIPSGASSVSMVWDWSNSYNSEQSRFGRYVLTYDGSGSISVGGSASVVSEQSGRIVFDINTGGLWSVDISSTNSGDYIRNVSVVREELVPYHEAGAIFNPDFLKIVKGARHLRFMDWMNTNDSQYSSWDQYPKKDWYTWVQGAPVEVMVALANEVGADPWFNMPHRADDEFVRNFAQYVHDNLDPDLQAYVELSNETWNWAFDQTGELVDMGKAEWSQSFVEQSGAYYVKRATEMMRIWEDVYGNQTSSRVVKVLAGQAGNTWLTENILLNGAIWQANEPSNWSDPRETFDAFAVTSYFGGSVVQDSSLMNSVLGMSQADAFATLDAYLLDPTNDRGVYGTIRGLEEHKAVLAPLGIDLILYEGGQHVHHSAFIDVAGDDSAVESLMTNYIRSQNMANLYQILWDGWVGIGDGPFMQFTDVGSPSQWGSWGLRASLHDTNPRAELIDSLNASTPAWFDNGGTHYQEGRVIGGTTGSDEVGGTEGVDTIMTGSGEDIIYPGPGNDYINGGAAEDVVLLTGNSSDYSINSSGDGYRVVGPDGSDYVFAVEFLVFGDGTNQELSGSINQGTDPGVINNTNTGTNTTGSTYTPPSSGTDVVDFDYTFDMGSDYSAGEDVRTTDAVNVRSSAGGVVVGAQPAGSSGTVLGSEPTYANGYTYVEVDFANGQDGWVAEDFVESTAQTTSSGSSAGGQFNPGDRVEATDTVNVRESAAGTLLGTQVAGSAGTVLDINPVSSGGYTYIAVNFDSGFDGWVAVDFLTDSNTQASGQTNNGTQTNGGGDTGDNRTPSPLTVRQIHSGHSLTDSAVYQVWPGHYSLMIDYLSDGNGNVGISTIPGSPMSWRWDHSSGNPDARNDIADWELLVITEGVPMGVNGSQADLRQWVEHAWNNGNNGNGAPTLLYATWTGLEQGEAAWRAELDDYVSRWEAMADYASAAVPAEARVYIVPGNYLMMRLYDDIQAGLVPGVTSIRDFFRDDIHTSHLGSYALALMHIAVIHHVDPHNVPGTGWGLSPEPSAALTSYLQDIVWEIAQEYPYAGVPGGAAAPSTPSSGSNAGQDTTASSQFNVGDRVETIAEVDVRNSAGGRTYGTRSAGSAGYVTDNPPEAVDGVTYIRVNFDNGTDGWVDESYLTAGTVVETGSDTNIGSTNNTDTGSNTDSSNDTGSNTNTNTDSNSNGSQDSSSGTDNDDNGTTDPDSSDLNVITGTDGPDELYGTDEDDYFVISGTDSSYEWDVVWGGDGVDYVEMPTSIDNYISAIEFEYGVYFEADPDLELGYVFPAPGTEYLVFPEGTYTVNEAVNFIRGASSDSENDDTTEDNESGDSNGDSGAMEGKNVIYDTDGHDEIDGTNGDDYIILSGAGDRWNWDNVRAGDGIDYVEMPASINDYVKAEEFRYGNYVFHTSEFNELGQVWPAPGVEYLVFPEGTYTVDEAAEIINGDNGGGSYDGGGDHDHSWSDSTEKSRWEKSYDSNDWYQSDRRTYKHEQDSKEDDGDSWWSSWTSKTGWGDHTHDWD